MTQIQDLSLSERVCYSTLRIEATIPPSSLSTGTGFLFNFKVDDNTSIPCLVTNKHVIDGSTKASIVISCTSPNGAVSHETVHVGTDNWISHPDGKTDLCVLPIQPIFAFLMAQGKTPFVAPLDESLVPFQSQLDDLSSIEEIIMIGYPDGIWDEFNNQPIVRRGITATHPKNNFNGAPLFLIDAACFPGSSGSPVLIFNQGGFVDKSGNLNWGSGRIMLLGVLFAGPQHNAEGMITFANMPKTNTKIPNNLGYVIKSSKLLDFKPYLLDLMNKRG